jgi:hypothetical protein
MSGKSSALRWGILSAGKISHDFVLALSTLPRSEQEVVAVGARDLRSAQAFANEQGIPKAFGSYEEVIGLAEIGNSNSLLFLLVPKIPRIMCVCIIVFRYRVHWSNSHAACKTL